MIIDLFSCLFSLTFVLFFSFLCVSFLLEGIRRDKGRKEMPRWWNKQVKWRGHWRAIEVMVDKEREARDGLDCVLP